MCAVVASEQQENRNVRKIKSKMAYFSLESMECENKEDEMNVCRVQAAAGGEAKQQSQQQQHKEEEKKWKADNLIIMRR